MYYVCTVLYMYCMYKYMYRMYNTPYMYCNMYCICTIHTCIVHGEYIEKNVNLIAQVSVDCNSISKFSFLALLLY